MIKRALISKGHTDVSEGSKRVLGLGLWQSMVPQLQLGKLCLTWEVIEKKMLSISDDSFRMLIYLCDTI